MKYNPEDHLKLVTHVAKRYSKNNRMEYQDIFQEGCIGLIRACNEYKEGDVPFGPFAAMHIQFSIMNALSKSNMINVCRDIIWIASAIKKMDLIDESVSEIAQKVGKKEKYVELALNHLKSEVLSLDYEYYGHKRDGARTLMEKLKYSETYEDEIFIEEVLEMYKIPERDKEIARLLMKGHTLTNACEILGENYKAAAQRKKERKKMLMDKKHLITE